MNKIDTPESLVIPFDPADPRKEGMMKDALRLGEITAKQHLKKKKRETQEARSEALEELEAAAESASRLLLACIVKATKASSDLQDMLRLVNKLSLLTGREKWTIARLLDTAICVCGYNEDGDPRWFNAQRKSKHAGVENLRVMRRAVQSGKVRFYLADGIMFRHPDDDDDTLALYLTANVTPATVSALHTMGAALVAFDLASEELDKIEAMTKDLPGTLETIEGSILRSRLNAESGGVVAVRAVENAIVAHLSGDVTALLLPAHNLTA